MIDQSTYRDIVKLLDAELNVDYISRYLGVDVKIVQGVADQTILVQPDPPKTPKSKPARKPAKRQPATMPPFPDLSALDDQQRIIVLTTRGLAVSKIRKHLKSPVWTEKQINRYVTNVLGPARKGVNNSQYNRISEMEAQWYTKLLVEAYGKDRYRCEICTEPVPGGATLHHTTYTNPTLFDLLFVCQSCNLARENVGLS